MSYGMSAVAVVVVVPLGTLCVVEICVGHTSISIVYTNTHTYRTKSNDRIEANSVQNKNISIQTKVPSHRYTQIVFLHFLSKKSKSIFFHKLSKKYS